LLDVNSILHDVWPLQVGGQLDVQILCESFLNMTGSQPFFQLGTISRERA
jgi:hypothetical protein